MVAMEKATEKQKNYAKLISEKLCIDLPIEDTKIVYMNFIKDNVEEYRQEIDREMNNNPIHKSVYAKENKTNSKFCDETFEKISMLKDSSGIYVFWHGDEIYYVGKSKNLRDRMLSSLAERHSDKNFIDYVSWFETKTVADAHILEPFLITKYKPRLNSEFNCGDYPTMFKLVEFDIYQLEKHCAYKIVKEVEDGTKKDV